MFGHIMVVLIGYLVVGLLMFLYLMDFIDVFQKINKELKLCKGDFGKQHVYMKYKDDIYLNSHLSNFLFRVFIIFFFPFYLYSIKEYKGDK